MLVSGRLLWQFLRQRRGSAIHWLFPQPFPSVLLVGSYRKVDNLHYTRAYNNFYQLKDPFAGHSKEVVAKIKSQKGISEVVIPFQYEVTEEKQIRDSEKMRIALGNFRTVILALYRANLLQ